jgi:chromosome segregation ATPase
MDIDAAAAPKADIKEMEELLLLVGELEGEVQRQRERADEAAVRLAQLERSGASNTNHATVQQLSQQAGLIARAVMEADESRSELQAQQLAKQQLVHELVDERTLRQRADATVTSLRAECDSLQTEVDDGLRQLRQLQQQLTSERASYQDNYARTAELSEAHTDAIRRVAELTARHTELESQLAIECTRHAQARTEVETTSASLQAQLATAQAANERLRELADEHQRQTQQLGRECARLQAAEQ